MSLEQLGAPDGVRGGKGGDDGVPRREVGGRDGRAQQARRDGGADDAHRDEKAHWRGAGGEKTKGERRSWRERQGPRPAATI